MTRAAARLLFVALLAASLVLIAYILLGATFFARFAGVGSDVAEVEFDEEVLTQTGIVQDRRLTEISGIGMSIRYPDACWVHNDSGHAAEVFLIALTGETLATVILPGAANIDWEDLCVFENQGGSYVCIGDVGDNAGRRESYQLYIFEEPELKWPSDGPNRMPMSVAIHDFKRLEFNYPDAARNCEAIAYDGNKKAIILVEKKLDKAKQLEPAGIYQLRLTRKLTLRAPGIPQKLATWPDTMVTGMDVARDGKAMLIRNYASARLVDRAVATDWPTTLRNGNYRLLPMPAQRQGEAICFTGDGEWAIVVSEFPRSPIWKINIQSALRQVDSPKNKKN